MHEYVYGYTRNRGSKANDGKLDVLFCRVVMIRVLTLSACSVFVYGYTQNRDSKESDGALDVETLGFWFDT